MEYPEGRGVLEKISSVGEVWKFNRYNLECFVALGNK